MLLRLPSCWIPTKLIKQSCDIFADFVCANINPVFKESIFPEQLKHADIKPEKFSIRKRKMADLSVFSLMSSRYMKSVCITSYVIVLMRAYQENNEVLKKYLVQ